MARQHSDAAFNATSSVGIVAGRSTADGGIAFKRIAPDERGSRRALCLGELLIMLGRYGWINGFQELDVWSCCKSVFYFYADTYVLGACSGKISARLCRLASSHIDRSVADTSHVVVAAELARPKFEVRPFVCDSCSMASLKSVYCRQMECVPGDDQGSTHVSDDESSIEDFGCSPSPWSSWVPSSLVGSTPSPQLVAMSVWGASPVDCCSGTVGRARPRRSKAQAAPAIPFQAINLPEWAQMTEEELHELSDSDCDDDDDNFADPCVGESVSMKSRKLPPEASIAVQQLRVDLCGNPVQRTRDHTQGHVWSDSDGDYNVAIAKYSTGSTSAGETSDSDMEQCCVSPACVIEAYQD